MRFDNYVASVLNISRNKASELIKGGKVLADGQICTKVSSEVSEAKISLLDEIYVGRGALKLKSFLEVMKFDLAGKNALDIGSSTGGFMQILLESDVKSVTGVDVGTDQLDASLRNDERVKIYEKTDVREFAKQNQSKFDLITCDVSFISLAEILPAICELASENSLIIMLFKPQFEVGVGVKRNKKGVVTDAKAVNLAMKRFEVIANGLGFKMITCKECEVKGKEGNAEFFYAFNKR
ncbi:23S rRNA (cytidine-2'-O)-methyltransferase TlyA [Campylobacter concisus]|uniref:23S rRNA (cytidine-2'-O)-methyltransferase TlyA n=1 Tax=Campylobacter concisus TaxID=199 RepID=UPI0018836EB6|nr:TlyA family RNA methyltransferase [Campylobacter concisus]MBE9818589.1 TlyA family RNA methyltransferase [Campylobacter concisus]